MQCVPVVAVGLETKPERKMETALRAWNCQWCSGAALNIQTYLKDIKAGTQGFVALDSERNRIVVAYRGSKNFANTIEDAKFWLTKAPFGPSGGKLDDNGFLQAYLSVRNGTLAAVAKAKEQCANCSQCWEDCKEGVCVYGVRIPMCQ